MERSMVDKGLAMFWAYLRISLLNKGYFYLAVCRTRRHLEVSHLEFSGRNWHYRNTFLLPDI